mgnify:CR=1 FL=1
MVQYDRMILNTENGLSLHGVKVIHDHLIIMAVTPAGHKQEFILLVAETDIPKRPVQLLEFRLGVVRSLPPDRKKISCSGITITRSS